MDQRGIVTSGRVGLGKGEDGVGFGIFDQNVASSGTLGIPIRSAHMDPGGIFGKNGWQTPGTGGGTDG